MSAFDLGLLNTSYNAADALSVAYPSDSYNFTLGNTQSLKLSLTGISAAVDWQLKDNQGTNLHSGSISPANVGAINLNNLPAGGYSIELSQTSGDTNYALNIDPLTKLNVESGFFTVGQTGQVGVDYLIDGGAYQGELAIFSLTGMEAFAPGSELFIQEVARRSLSNSPEGYVTIQDATEAAKFSPTFPWGDNQNSGEYKNIKTFTMKPGDKFGFMLVPNGTVQEVFDNPNIGGAKRPLFSLVTTNPNEAFHVGQIADITGDGKTFVMEDKRVDAGSDKDYNDLVFRITGATGKAVKLDDVIDPGKDWRSEKIGEELRDYINTAPKSLQFTTKSVYKASETVKLTDATVYDENGDLMKVDFWLKKQNEVEWADIKDAESFTISEDWASFNYSLDDLMPGSYEIKAIAFDKFEHQSEEIVKDFLINAAPKDLQFSLLKDTYDVGETISITGGQVYDADGIDDLVKIDLFLKKDNNDWQDIADDAASFTAGSGNTNLANFSKDLIITEAGNYQIKGVAYDKAGDASNVVIHNLTVRSETVEPPVPNSPPEQLEFNLLPSYTIDQPVSINDAKVYDKNGESDLKDVKLILYKDNDNVPQEITVNIVDNSKSGDGWGTFNYSWSNLGEGNYRLEAKAFDKSNGVSNQISRSFSVVGKPPVLGINTPPEKLQLNLLPSYQFGQTVNFANAKVYDEDGLDDLDKVTLELYKDNKKLGNYTVGIVDDGIIGDKWGTFNISFDRLEPGNYQINAIAFDKSGATDTDTTNFTINLPVNKPPEDLRFNILPLYTNAETISFDGARVYDPDGVGDLTKVDFWLQHPDGRWVDITDVTSEQFTTDSKGRARFGYNYDLSGLAPGRYQLRAIAQDKAGHSSIPATQTFSVITDPGGIGLSDEVRLAMVEAANLENYDPQALAQTREWVVWVTPGKSSSELAALLGAEDLGATGQIPNSYIWKFPDNITPQDVANELGKLNGVEFAYPQVPVEIKLLHQPQDVLFPYQWNLAKTNVSTAWDTISPVTSQPVRGKNVVIGIVDDGIAYNHPDLQARYNAALSWDFSDNDSNPVPSSNKLFDQDIAPPKVDPLSIKFEKLVNLTGMVTDVNVTLNISKSLSPDLPNPTNLTVFLYSPDESAFDPGNWGNSLSIPRFPGRDDLKFKQKVQLLIREDGSVEFDRNKLNGCYAGGIWRLEIENPDVNKYDQAKLQRLSQELLNSWLLQIQTLNPHGTAVAGIAGASEDGKGIVGVAPEAQLAGLRLIGNIDQFTGTYKSDGRSIADALFQVIPRPNQPNRNQYIDVFNNSWGPQYMNRQPLALAALELGSTFGRNGLGNSYVFAAGNDGYWGGNVNYNYFANSRQAIAVASVDNIGIHSPYSTSGASVLVSAPSDNDKKSGFVGIYTTSISTKNWYANDFGGTSAAAPLVSGTIALMLEANPNLTARDVRHILVKTAQPTDVIKDAKGNIQTGNGWTRNQAGYWFNDKYGFGVIDVAKAVSTAANWTNVVTEDRFQSAVQVVNDKIPEGNGGLDSSIIKVDRDITVETVEVLLDTDHQNWADLKVVLTSPDGTQSVLSQPILGDILPLQPHQNGFKINNWNFTSVRQWGESSKGNWKLQVFDAKNNEFKGVWNSWKLNIYGTKPIVSINADDPNASESGNPGQFMVTRTGNIKNPLIVNYTVGGTATNGTDYKNISKSVIIPAGKTSASIPIITTGKDDAVYEGDETVILNLNTDPAYNVGVANSGTVVIADNDSLPKSIIVTNTNDIGAGSLRAAIEFANTNPGKDTIRFNISTTDPGYNSLTGAFTIQPTSALPTITDPVIIDGTTQVGFARKPIIELDGSKLTKTAGGLGISAGNSTVRGLVINRFLTGITLQNKDGNLIEGNYIGTDVTGTKSLGNIFEGLMIWSSNNRIGGTTAQARNIISGNGWQGVAIYNSTTNSATGNVVQGNYIGTDVTGTKTLSNLRGGIIIGGANNNLIGGTTVGTANIISGNSGAGILLGGGTGNVVQSNYIGTDITGTNRLGNTEGITVGGSNHIIKGNTIAFNTGSGVSLTLNGKNNAVISNAIFSNTGIGVDLASNGITPNDAGDIDTGDNNVQNFPILTSAISNSNNTTIKGSLNSTANTTFRVELFSNQTLDPSGYGEGEKFLGFQNVTTDSSGNATFTIDLPTSVPLGQFITATATDPNNNTSEFSQGIQINSNQSYKWVSYTVRPGDTLAQIALDTMGDFSYYKFIAEHNGLTNPGFLYVGQVIEIPIPIP